MRKFFDISYHQRLESAKYDSKNIWKQYGSSTPKNLIHRCSEMISLAVRCTTKDEQPRVKMKIFPTLHTLVGFHQGSMHAYVGDKYIRKKSVFTSFISLHVI